MILFDDVSFAYPVPGGSVAALRGVSFTLDRGQSLAVVGANGSGKSTLARLANGLLLPTSGRVVVEGIDTRADATIWDVRRRIGIVFQNPENQIVGTVVEEDVAFGPENLGIEPPEIAERVSGALSAVGLEGFERREPHLLSGGQKQRLVVAGALAMRPDYLVLDEPTSMLDPEGREDVLRVLEGLKARHQGVLHVTHDLSDAARADRVLVLAAGEAVFLGAPSELLARPDDLGAWGLALPALGHLRLELHALGIEIPSVALDVDSVVSALCPST
jgi:energy-coupling factor transport system ATP-binding protein